MGIWGEGKIRKPRFSRCHGYPYEAISHKADLFGDAERQRVSGVRGETAADIDLSRYHKVYLDMQEEINLPKDTFRERFGENPRKDDLTILVPRQDDPTEQAC